MASESIKAAFARIARTEQGGLIDISSGVTGESKYWEDADLELIPRIFYNHDEKELDKRLLLFKEMTTINPSKDYFLLTNWVAYQVVDPQTRKYLFYEPTEITNLLQMITVFNDDPQQEQNLYTAICKIQPGKIFPEHLYGNYTINTDGSCTPDDKGMTNIHNFIASLIHSAEVSKGLQDVLDSIDYNGLNLAQRQISEYDRVLLPAFALFLLRLPYRSMTEITVEYINRACFFLKTMYGYLTTEHDYSICDRAVDMLKQNQYATQSEINGVIVPALRSWKLCNEGRKIRAVTLLSYCLLLHTKWHGLASMSRLITLTRQLKRPMEFFLIAARASATAAEVDLLSDFIFHYIPIGYEDATAFEGLDKNIIERAKIQSRKYRSGEAKPSVLYPWARALDTVYFATLSNKSMLYLPVLWAYVIDFKKVTPLWSSPTLENIPTYVDHPCKKLAEHILHYLQIVATIRKEDNPWGEFQELGDKIPPFNPDLTGARAEAAQMQMVRTEKIRKLDEDDQDDDVKALGHSFLK